MVVGYKKENLKEYLIHSKYTDMEFIFIDNDIYNVSNNIYSLYLAKKYLEEDDTLLLESDLIFDKKLITSILENSNPNIAAVSKYQSWMDGTVVTVDNEHNILQFVEKKDIQNNKLEEYYKTINIYKLSKEFSKNVYLPFLETFMEVYGKNEYYELAFKIIANLSRSDFKAEIINDIKWYEIDNEHDLEEASKIFK